MAINGVGTTIAFQSGLFGEILSASRSGIERAAIQTSHFGTTGAHTYMPAKLMEPGRYEIEMVFDPTDNIDTIMSATGETVIVTHTNMTGTTHSTSGFAVSAGTTYQFEDRVIANYTLQLSGLTTVA